MITCNEKKFCFIICYNDEFQLRECLLYLSLLQVPEGYETELITITDAQSMASGYNEGMRASDARYKIYLHQDTFIVEPRFLYKLLRIFRKDKKIGMVGIIGAEKLSNDGVMWHEKRCGNFYQLDRFISGGFDGIEHLRRSGKEVEVVDGLLMATQYDLPWREDILKGWDFYDVSQCMEFRRAGYKIVVPAQKDLWVLHVCGIPNYWHYNENRKIILKEYPEIASAQPGRLRILFLHSNMIVLVGLACSLTELGHNVVMGAYQPALDAYSEKDVESVEELLEEGHYDLVVTYDFSPGVSDACNNMGVKYYSWIYDCPLLQLYSKQVLNPVNYISVFDKKQYERLQKKNLAHLFYLPLAPEVDMFGGININKRDEKKYKADVAFVGRLYDQSGYDELFEKDSDKGVREEADALVRSCGCVWDGNTNIFNRASEGLINHMVSRLSEEYWKKWDMEKRYFCESLKLVRKCNELERVTILNRLAEEFEVVLYTEDTSKKSLRNIKIRPWADYMSVMPKVFYLSKINLNITSRSIESGIPQRVWDIMAVGGFCLTNYQPELEDYFVPGQDLEVYHNLDELVEKVRYYLENEDERVRIAINGYKKVRQNHDSKMRLKKVLENIFSEKKFP